MCVCVCLCVCVHARVFDPCLTRAQIMDLLLEVRPRQKARLRQQLEQLLHSLRSTLKALPHTEQADVSRLMHMDLVSYPGPSHSQKKLCGCCAPGYEANTDCDDSLVVHGLS